MAGELDAGNPHVQFDAGALETLRQRNAPTGQTLWALSESGMKPAYPMIRRGVLFLLRTQHEDGS